MANVSLEGASQKALEEASTLRMIFGLILGNLDMSNKVVTLAYLPL
jgi:hypothetical protein